MSFNPQEFLDSSITEANDTKITPVPIGEYLGIIEKTEARQWQSKDGTKTGIAVDVTWLVEDSAVKELLGRDVVTVRQGIMLDVLPSGALDMGAGKNVALGRLREAVGKNNPGDVFSFSQLNGLTAKIAVTHREHDGNQYAEVRSVAKFS